MGAPFVTLVTYGTNDGLLAIGDTITFTVTYDKNVAVTGSPILNLDSGGTATYVSGSGTSTLTFTYTVSAGQSSSDLSVTGLNLNGGTIKAGQTDAVNTGAATNPTGTVVVDGIVPTATVPASLTASGSNATLSGFSVSDNSSGTITVTLSADAGGTITLTNTSGLTVSGNGTGTVTVSGTASTINSALTTTNYHSPITETTSGDIDGHITVHVTDAAGNSSSTYSVNVDVTCFMAGTLIRTPEGDVAVEKLQVGQLVTLADGRALPVRWIGQQTIALLFADPLKTAPICIKAGALDENVPSRDLYTSAGHSMFVDGILALSGALVNGSSIQRFQTSAPRIKYYHVELEEHAIIFANDAATESFVDNVSRETFDNFADYKKLYGEPKPIVEMDLPVAKSQRQVPSKIRARLAARAAAIGAVKVSAA